MWVLGEPNETDALEGLEAFDKVINVDQSPGLAVRFKIAGIPRLFVIDGPDVRGFPPQHHADLAATLEAGTWKTEPIISGGILSPLGYPYGRAQRIREDG